MTEKESEVRLAEVEVKLQLVEVGKARESLRVKMLVHEQEADLERIELQAEVEKQELLLKKEEIRLKVVKDELERGFEV